MSERAELKKRITEWLFSPKWTSAHTEFDEIEALVVLVESERTAAPAEAEKRRVPMDDVQAGPYAGMDPPASGEIYRCKAGHTFQAVAHSRFDGAPYHCPECGNIQLELVAPASVEREAPAVAALQSCGCVIHGETITPCSRHLGFWRNTLRKKAGEGQSTQPAPAGDSALREALERIVNGDSEYRDRCYCKCDDENCCEVVGEYCPWCIARRALATQQTKEEGES